jgi:CBS domain containing-hemolysin-like protein
MLLLTYFLIAVGISFLCSILEAVILSLTPAYVQSLTKTNPKLAKRLVRQKDNIDLSIGAILTLNTFAHTLGAAGVGAEAVKIFGEEFMFYISAVLTLLILIFSEIIPKTIGAVYWKQLSGISSYLINILVFITYPLLLVMNKITAFISSKKDHKNITKEEIEAVVSMGESEGVLKEKDGNIIENILHLNSIKVKDIFTPRKVMFTLSIEDLKRISQNKIDNDLELEKLKEYSRVPIYDKNIDDIVGVLLSKEFFFDYIKNTRDIEKLVKPVYSVNENISVSRLLDLFLKKKEHLFMVVDNFGQTEGIVTLEDAMETVLGQEIIDELDKNIDLREIAKNS